MNTLARLALALVVFVALRAAASRDAASPARAAATGDAACEGKRPNDLCPMSDGAGGVCTPSPCAGGGTCITRDGPARATGPGAGLPASLACTSGPLNSPETDVAGPFIAIGASITLTCAVIVVLRLRKHWGDKP